MGTVTATPQSTTITIYKGERWRLVLPTYAYRRRRTAVKIPSRIYIKYADAIESEAGRFLGANRQLPKRQQDKWVKPRTQPLRIFRICSQQFLC